MEAVDGRHVIGKFVCCPRRRTAPFQGKRFVWFPISYSFAKDAKWATWSTSGDICGTFDGRSRGDRELPAWCLKDNECEFLSSKQLTIIFGAGFTGEDFGKLLESEPRFSKAAVMRAGRELAAALRKEKPSLKRKRVAEDAEGDEEVEKAEPRRSGRTRPKRDENRE